MEKLASGVSSTRLIVELIALAKVRAATRRMLETDDRSPPSRRRDSRHAAG